MQNQDCVQEQKKQQPASFAGCCKIGSVVEK